MSVKPLPARQDNSDITTEVRVHTIPAKTIVRRREERRIPEIVITNHRTGQKLVNRVWLLADVLLED
jgi:hypothetical protein